MQRFLYKEVTFTDLVGKLGDSVELQFFGSIYKYFTSC